MENKKQTGFIFDENISLENLGNGLKRKILGFDKELMLVKVIFEKGAIGYIHKHIHSQVSYITKGAFEVTIANEKKILREGDSFYIEPNVEHGVFALEDSELIDIFSPYREDFIK
ncbi:MAG: cupin domain-containing protein [Melioribacteraceae bacterium]|nr:cupin domain-containing protein [Melioribacteraceae bacterium]